MNEHFKQNLKTFLLFPLFVRHMSPRFISALNTTNLHFAYTAIYDWTFNKSCNIWSWQTCKCILSIWLNASIIHIVVLDILFVSIKSTISLNGSAATTPPHKFYFKEFIEWFCHSFLKQIIQYINVRSLYNFSVKFITPLNGKTKSHG